MRFPYTLWLRILGKGRVQQQAIDELESLPKNEALRSSALELLYSLKTTLEVSQNIDEEDRNLIMRLSPLYTQRLEEATRQGLQQGVQQGLQQGQRQVVENLLRSRFGSLDDQLLAIIEPLLSLPTEEFIPLLLQLSREELIARFGNQSN
jgi:flagellar biosynthesis/type III secretory pathway protein FliH